MAPRKSLILVRARGVIRKAASLAAPVDIMALAKESGFEITFKPNGGGLCGVVLSRRGKTPIIGVNSDHSEARQRFAAAHALGHALLRHSGKIYADRDVAYLSSLGDATQGGTTPDEEAEANWFASEILLPDPLFQPDLAAIRGLDLSSGEAPYAELEKLAEKYRVSPSLVFFRLVHLESLARAPKVEQT